MPKVYIVYRWLGLDQEIGDAYCIFDGTIETAEEVEAARREILRERTDARDVIITNWLPLKG